jgi:pimeloyl-ACP methyl ester carboxylesterase
VFDLTNETYIKTSHGVLALEEVGEGNFPVVMIHGNSSCRNIFRKQMESDLFSGCRLIAVDLSGHGRSENAVDADETYTLPGLAEAVSELLESIGVSDPVVFGWSLGGHIAIEMLARFRQMRALLLCGTPPIGKHQGKNNMAEGFNNSPRSFPTPDRRMNENEARSFVDRILRGTGDDHLVEAAMRTDGRFRRRLLESSLEGFGVNQKNVVETAQIPIGVINGAEDGLIKAEFFQQLVFPNLWEGKIHIVQNAGHAPFWEKPREFNQLLSRFLSFARKSSKKG